MTTRCRKCNSNLTYVVVELGTRSLGCSMCGERDYNIFVRADANKIIRKWKSKQYDRREKYKRSANAA